MSMQRSFAVLAALATIAAAPPGASADFDRVERPGETEVAYRFRCRHGVTTVRYTARELPLAQSSVDQARTVELVELGITGRAIGSTDLARAEAQFRSYAWMEQVRASCYEGAVDIVTRGMRIEDWAAALRQAQWRRPPMRSTTLRVARDGSISVP